LGVGQLQLRRAVLRALRAQMGKGVVSTRRDVVPFEVGQVWEATNGQQFKVVYVSPSGRFIRWTTRAFGWDRAEARVSAAYARRFVRLVDSIGQTRARAARQAES
jgi:hypothetical protein